MSYAGHDVSSVHARHDHVAKNQGRLQGAGDRQGFARVILDYHVEAAQVFEALLQHFRKKTSSSMTRIGSAMVFYYFNAPVGCMRCR